MASYINGRAPVNRGATSPAADRWGKAPLLPHFTQIADIILDRWMSLLTGAEFKVVLYVARRTYGWGKAADEISLKQMASGITSEDGQYTDYGTGLSKETISKSVGTLIEKGILIAHRQTDARGADLPNAYSLNLESTFGQEGDPDENVPPRVRFSDTPVSEIPTPPPGKSDTPNPENLTPPVSEFRTHNKQQSGAAPSTPIHIHEEKQQHIESGTVSDTVSDVAAPSDLDAIRAVTALGISASDATSIVGEVGALVAFEQAQWWPLRKAATTATEPGAVFRTACRAPWPAPRSRATSSPRPTSTRRRIWVSGPKNRPADFPVHEVPVWADALAILEREVNKPMMETHIRRLTPTLAGDELVLAAADAFAKGQLETRYRERIESAASTAAGRPLTVRFTIAEGAAHV